MKFYMKKARGYYRVVKHGVYGSNMFLILARGTSIPRDTIRIFHVFADLYQVNRVFNVWKCKLKQNRYTLIRLGGATT